MPVVRLNEKTWERLKQWAAPLEDNPDSTINKLLDAAESSTRPDSAARSGWKAAPINGMGRLARGVKTQEREFEKPILEALYELGGRGIMYEVLPIVEEKVRPVLKEVDYERLPSGDTVRWRSTAQWARHRLAERGLIKRGSARGIWELSDHGSRTVGQWMEESAL